MRRAQETNVLNLSTDAMLAAADELHAADPGNHPFVIGAIQAGGNIRADIDRTAVTGDLTFADLFRVLPLGKDPETGETGYPLVQVQTLQVVIKLAFELGVSVGLQRDSEFLVPGGMKIEYDLTRPAMDFTDMLNGQIGRITKITVRAPGDDLDNPTSVIYDMSRGAGLEWTGSFAARVPLVTSYYIASFAASIGAPLYDNAGNPRDITTRDGFLALVMQRADDSHILEWEAFIQYIHDQSAANASPGYLPDRYDESKPVGALPRRMICTHGC
jgi:5'-nucleotidase-like protein